MATKNNKRDKFIFVANSTKQNFNKQQNGSNNFEEIAKTIAAVVNDTTGRTINSQNETKTKKLPITKCPTNILAANLAIQQSVKSLKGIF